MAIDEKPLDEFWERWCRQAAADKGISYEEVVAKLASGQAALEVRFVVGEPPKMTYTAKP